LIPLRFGPAGAIIEAIEVQVVDVDSEEQRREDAPLGNTSKRGEPVRGDVVLGNSEHTVGEKATKPAPSLTLDIGFVKEFVEQEVVRDAVEGFDDVELSK
jgi:hypothetical protein